MWPLPKWLHSLLPPLFPHWPPKIEISACGPASCEQTEKEAGRGRKRVDWELFGQIKIPSLLSVREGRIQDISSLLMGMIAF